MSSNHLPVEQLKNIGPKTAALLREAGIHTRADLQAIGAVMAYKILKYRFRSITAVALYALHGALEDVHWNSLPAEEKKLLLEEANQDIDVIP